MHSLLYQTQRLHQNTTVGIQNTIVEAKFFLAENIFFDCMEFIVHQFRPPCTNHFKCHVLHHLCMWHVGRKEGNVLFNDAINTFYLQLYGIEHLVRDHYVRGETHCGR